MVFYWIISGLIAFSGLTAQAENCGGLLDADDGDLEIQPSNSSCLWIIKLQSLTGINLELKHSTMEPIIVIPEQIFSRPDLESAWIIGPSNVYKFQGEMLAILAPPRNHKVTISWAGVTLDSSQVTLSAKCERNSEGLIEWTRRSYGPGKVFWAVEPEEAGQFNWDLKSNVPYCMYYDRCACVSFWVIHFMPDGSMSYNKKTCELGSTVGSLKVEKNSKILVLVSIRSSSSVGSKLQVTWESDGKPLRGNLMGMLVGTEGGLHVGRVNSSTFFRVYSKRVNGLAFDWNSEKMYWAEQGAGIMRANVDGSDFEQLIVDEHTNGVGIEPFTGNLYYGSNSRSTLRVCHNDGKKCSTVIHLSGAIWDIAIHPSKGFLFWSIEDTKIVRANLDGSNVTDVVTTPAMGISVDESNNRLFTFDRSTRQIIDYDLNGEDVKIQNVTIDLMDMEMAGDKLYFGSWSSNSVHSVAKADSKSSWTNSSNGGGYVALFGERISVPRVNPCEKAKCSHLCVLITASSYRCLCPDGKKLKEDDISCGF